MASKLEAYPTPNETRSGCKVDWYIYTDQAKAKEASNIAVRNARVLEGQGFEWGFQTPGNIDELDGGRYMVTIP